MVMVMLSLRQVFRIARHVAIRAKFQMMLRRSMRMAKILKKVIAAVYNPKNWENRMGWEWFVLVMLGGFIAGLVNVTLS
jgi:hypothetical protein|tara:strand:- start:21067 stop:21303 length:237 start_codon:yes stop_codon:yes gene_type:complete